MKIDNLIIIALFIIATGYSGQTTIKHIDMPSIENDTTYIEKITL